MARPSRFACLGALVLGSVLSPLLILVRYHRAASQRSEAFRLRLAQFEWNMETSRFWDDNTTEVGCREEEALRRRQSSALVEVHDNGALLNPYPFRFLIEERLACCRAKGGRSGKRLRALILVRTQPAAFVNRLVIRGTWARQRWQKQFRFLVVFVMGFSDDAVVQRRLEEESERYRDVIQSNFLNDYWNNTYLTMSALKWSLLNCADSAEFFVKTDDDFAINVFRLATYVDSILARRGAEQSRRDLTLRCAVISVNLAPIRTTYGDDGKYYMSYEQWPDDRYPTYCPSGGLMLTEAANRRLYTESHYHRSFPLEDVFFTGIVAENISGLRFESMEGRIVNWVHCTWSVGPCLDEHRQLMFYHSRQDVELMTLVADHWRNEYEGNAAAGCCHLNVVLLLLCAFMCRISLA